MSAIGGDERSFLGIALSANGTYQYPEPWLETRLEARIWSIQGRGKASYFVTSLSRLKSVHIRSLPSFLLTRTTGALYGLFDGRIMFFASMSLISIVTTVIFLGASLWGASLMGSVSTVSFSCCINWVYPISLLFNTKTSLNSRSSAYLSSVGWFLSGIAKEQICSTSSSQCWVRFVSRFTACRVLSVVSQWSRQLSASVSQRCTCLRISGL